MKFKDQLSVPEVNLTTCDENIPFSIDAEGCLFSVVIPVFHESEIIHSAIKNLHEHQFQENLEIIVVDGADQRDTIEVIHEENVICLESEKGRARQMNAGAAVARGDVLVFLHADTIVPANAFHCIKTVLEDTKVVGGAFDLGIRSNRSIFKIIGKVASLRSRITRLPYGDQCIFLRRKYFHAIGGYRDVPLMEDVEIMQRIKRRGDIISILPEKVWTTPRRWEGEGILYCTLRNWIVLLLYCFGVSPHKLIRYYRSNGEIAGNTGKITI
jgi:rSAM/selenodomain-associated transferase 2